MKTDKLYREALELNPLTVEEGLFLYENAPLAELMMIGSKLRDIHTPGSEVGWMIDRNVNITNICFSQCAFCNFCRKKGDSDSYITTLDEYRIKISEMIALGGNQLLLQGGMNPALGLGFYTSLFQSIKNEFPGINLHALGPPEIVWLAKKEKTSVREVLMRFNKAGLDSLPGAGAEILSDRVRKIVSPAKSTTAEWLDVMREAHILNLPTSATMMFGHSETKKERIEHLAILRELQEKKPAGNYGFVTFVPWPFQDKGTRLAELSGVRNSVTSDGYVRMVAISRIMLNNIANIQSSLLTVGPSVAMVTLHAGANDLGSIMIEENVVSSAGAGYRLDATEMKSIICQAGFTPRRRDQKYQTIRD